MVIAGLVPAAGASRRMGRDKRRLPLGPGTVLEQTVSVLRQAGLAPIVVVLEADSPCRALPGLAGVLFAVNPQPERGMLSSIRVGLAALPAASDAVAVLPGDHPFVPVAALTALLEHFRATQPLLLVPRYREHHRDAARRGHPLFIARALFAEAAACDDAIGLRQLLQRRPADLSVLELALPGADADLDTPEDYARLAPLLPED